MFTKSLKIKKVTKKLTCKILFVALLANFGLASLAPAANAEVHPIANNGSSWCWMIDWESINDEGGEVLQSITEMFIASTDDCSGIQVVGDLYDNFGYGSVNGDRFNWELSNSYVVGAFDDNNVLIPEHFVGDEFVIPGNDEDDTTDSTYTVLVEDNNVLYTISNSVSAQESLQIEGDLGSDQATRFITLGDHLFSYQVINSEDYVGLQDGQFYQQNFMPTDDPILLWETTPGAIISTSAGSETRDNLNEYVYVSLTGDSLYLKHYAFAYEINGAVYQTNNLANDRINNQKNTEQFFAQFLAFVNEGQTRTDIFTYNFRNWVPEQSLRQTANLSFSQSQYGSDTLSDPNGELRKTLDSINAKYGNLIK
jgi:hypothetical protein